MFAEVYQIEKEKLLKGRYTKVGSIVLNHYNI